MLSFEGLLAEAELQRLAKTTHRSLTVLKRKQKRRAQEPISLYCCTCYINEIKYVYSIYLCFILRVFSLCSRNEACEEVASEASHEDFPPQELKRKLSVEVSALH